MAQSVYTLDHHSSALERWKATGSFLLTQHKSLSGFHINVTAGAHSGVASAFEGQPYRIGSGADNNLILFGDDLAENHARLSPTGKLGNQLRIDAVEGPIGIGDRGTLRAGEWTTIDRLTTITLGGAEIDVSPILDPRRITRFAVMIGSIAILAFIVSYIIASSWSDSSRSIGAMMNPMTDVQSQIIQAAPLSQAEIAAAKGLSQIRLGELGIAHLVKLTELDGNSFLAEGLVPDSVRDRWNSFLQWYDSQSNYPTMVNNVTFTGVEQDIPAIATVWLDNKPMVEFSDGTVGYVGSTIQGGWTIGGIFAERVDLVRNGVTIAITLAGGAS